ncbi:hypothetical protein TNCV_2723451 [Trichonephila clavipes]|nr:hypothetical protein TNCV_2723451 [Trichonephila clavipes]
MVPNSWLAHYELEPQCNGADAHYICRGSKSSRCHGFVTFSRLAGQPIGVTVHFTQQPIREQSLSSQPSQKLFQTRHPDEAPKPRLPDPIDHAIAVMPPSRM